MKLERAASLLNANAIAWSFSKLYFTFIVVIIIEKKNGLKTCMSNILMMILGDKHLFKSGYAINLSKHVPFFCM